MCLSNFKFNEDELKRAFPKYFKNMGFEGRGMQISLPANMDLRLFAETTVPEELVKKAWAKQTWTTAMKDLFFGKFMGEGVNNIIQVLNDLEKEAGDRITQSLVLKLKGDGVTGDDILEGNEEKMEYRSFDFTINQLRNAVRLKGKFEEKKSKENMRKNAKDGLSILFFFTHIFFTLMIYLKYLQIIQQQIKLFMAVLVFQLKLILQVLLK